MVVLCFVFFSLFVRTIFYVIIFSLTLNVYTLCIQVYAPQTYSSFSSTQNPPVYISIFHEMLHSEKISIPCFNKAWHTLLYMVHKKWNTTHLRQRQKQLISQIVFRHRPTFQKYHLTVKWIQLSVWMFYYNDDAIQVIAHYEGHHYCLIILLK